MPIRKIFKNHHVESSESFDESTTTLIQERTSVKIGSLTNEVDEDSTKTPLATTYGSSIMAIDPRGSIKERLPPSGMAINRLAAALVAWLQATDTVFYLAILYMLRMKFHMSAARIALLLGVLKTPLLLKPVFAALSDTVPFFGYRRKSYIMLASAVAFFSLLPLACGVNSIGWSFGCLMVFYTASAACATFGDGLVVEMAHTSERPAMEVLGYQGSKKIWLAIMCSVSNILVLNHSIRAVFACFLPLPVVVFVVAIFISEPSGGHVPAFNGFKDYVKKSLTIFECPVIKYSLMYLVIYSLTPSCGTAMFFFLTEELDFSSTVMALCQALHDVADFLGILIFAYFLMDANIRVLNLWTTILVTPFILANALVINRWNQGLGIPDAMFVLSDTAIKEMFLEIQFIPFLILVARACPPGIESTLLNVCFTIMNFAMFCGTILSAWLISALGTDTEGVNSDNHADYVTNMNVLVIIVCLANLIPLAFISWLPNTSLQDEQMLEEARTCLKRSFLDHCARADFSDDFSEETTVSTLESDGDNLLLKRSKSSHLSQQRIEEAIGTEGLLSIQDRSEFSSAILG